MQTHPEAAPCSLYWVAARARALDLCPCSLPLVQCGQSRECGQSVQMWPILRSLPPSEPVSTAPPWPQGAWPWAGQPLLRPLGLSPGLELSIPLDAKLPPPACKRTQRIPAENVPCSFLLGLSQVSMQARIVAALGPSILQLLCRTTGN